MTSTGPTTIRTRVGQCLAATALITGLACGAHVVANAEPREWDIEVYDKCVERGTGISECCLISGGDLSDDGHGNPKCVAPPVLQSPQGPTGPLQPLITAPRGPNSGTLE